MCIKTVKLGKNVKNPKTLIATLGIIGHVLFMNFFYEYHCLWLAYPYLFVCVFVVCAMIV